MKVTKEQSAENKERVIEVAGRLFRERGFDGIGVVDLMKEAGLTHGGFYKQFESKEDLMAQATDRALLAAMDGWQAAVEGSERPLDGLLSWYVSPRHRDAPGLGCVLTALGPDASRQGEGVRNAITSGVRRFVDVLKRCVAGESTAARREHALATLSSMVGAVVLARAVNDEALSRDLLRAVRRRLADYNA
jgi:TetR/AcrR family transcriptional repressor of nem operon